MSQGRGENTTPLPQKYVTPLLEQQLCLAILGCSSLLPDTDALQLQQLGNDHGGEPVGGVPMGCHQGQRHPSKGRQACASHALHSCLSER
jgi:hypothetical protein